MLLEAWELLALAVADELVLLDPAARTGDGRRATRADRRHRAGAARPGRRSGPSDPDELAAEENEDEPRPEDATELVEDPADEVAPDDATVAVGCPNFWLGLRANSQAVLATSRPTTARRSFKDALSPADLNLAEPPPTSAKAPRVNWAAPRDLVVQWLGMARILDTQRSRRASPAAVLVVALAAPSGVRARPTPTLEERKQHQHLVEEGAKLHQAHDDAGALAKFQEAYALFPHAEAAVQHRADADDPATTPMPPTRWSDSSMPPRSIPARRERVPGHGGEAPRPARADHRAGGAARCSPAESIVTLDSRIGHTGVAYLAPAPTSWWCPPRASKRAPS